MTTMSASHGTTSPKLWAPRIAASTCRATSSWMTTVRAVAGWIEEVSRNSRFKNAVSPASASATWGSPGPRTRQAIASTPSSRAGAPHGSSPVTARGKTEAGPARGQLVN
jgi:hypothetical protein